MSPSQPNDRSVRANIVHWYRDLALGVCLFLLLLAGINELIEGVTAWPDGHDRLRLGAASLAVSAVCVMSAASKSAVLIGAIAILGGRGAFAFILQSRPLAYVGLAVSVLCVAALLLIVRTMKGLPYDLDKSKLPLDAGAAALGIGAAVLIFRMLKILVLTA